MSDLTESSSVPGFKTFPLLAFSVQILLIVFFALCVDYGPEADGADPANGLDPLYGGKRQSQNSIYKFYYDTDADIGITLKKTKRKMTEPGAARKCSKFAVATIAFEILFLVLFGTLVEYDDSALPKNYTASNATLGIDYDDPSDIVEHFYPMFQDVHVMVFIGFGFLFTFLKKYGYSAVGVNLFLAAIVIQLAILCEGFFATVNGRIKIGIESLLTADVAAAAALISWGALLGKTSPLQLLVMVLIEIPLYATNEWLALKVYKANDPGASMVCHTFGAYFGLAAAVVLYRREHCDSSKEGSIYHSDVFAMIGTVFLWLFWPSFNAALTSGDDRHRAIINTYLSLAACCVMTFAISAWVNEKGRFNMVHVQNATLAGGVAVGTACDTMMGPFVALLIGSIASIICTLGFKYLTPFLAQRLRLHDTCGVNDLHGMMGIFGGIVGAIMAGVASENLYGLGLYIQYPAMAPLLNSNELKYVRSGLIDIQAGSGRTASMQAGFQLIALATSLGIGIGGGLVAGLIMRLSIFDPPKEHQLYDDDDYWEVPEDDEEVAMSPEPSYTQAGRHFNGRNSLSMGTQVAPVNDSKL